MIIILIILYYRNIANKLKSISHRLKFDDHISDVQSSGQYCNLIPILPIPKSLGTRLLSLKKKIKFYFLSLFN